MRWQVGACDGRVRRFQSLDEEAPKLWLGTGEKATVVELGGLCGIHHGHGSHAASPRLDTMCLLGCKKDVRTF